MKIWITLLFVAMIFTLSAQAAAPTCGLTIITHGFEDPSVLHGGSDPFPQWVRAMATAINNRTGGSVPIYRVWFDPNTSQVSLLDGATSIDIGQTGGAIILLDWSDLAYVTTITAQSFADSFFIYLFGQTHNGHSLANVPIHLIGHSRGCSLNTRLAYLLAINGILIDQVTTLDPHPCQPLDVPFQGNDLIPTTYINVLFADNYWQSHLLSFPDGMQIQGTYDQNRFLDVHNGY